MVNRFGKLIESNSFQLFTMKIIGKPQRVRNGYAACIPVAKRPAPPPVSVYGTRGDKCIRVSTIVATVLGSC